MSRNRVEIISLGGSGGFGLNATLYVADGEGLLVDYGTGFWNGDFGGVARLVPDGGAFVDRCERLHGIVLTHGHDDHHAALAFLPAAWRDVPIYGPPLALAFALDRLEDLGAPRPEMVPLRPGDPIELGPFRVRGVHVTHSIPDTMVLAVDSPAGLIVHTGDFRFDAAPTIGPPSDREGLRELGERGVRLVLCDSTGAVRDGSTRTEESVDQDLAELLDRPSGQIVVSTFSSQLHRLQSVVKTAPRVGRKVACLGYRMTRTIHAALDLGLFELPAGVLVPPEDLSRRPEHERIWLAGGCQGEPESSLNKLSWDSSSRANVGPGDVVIVTASVIPGSEIAYGRMVDRLLRRGVEVVDAGTRPSLHASGHGARDEIREMLELLRPRAVVPVHGDRRHLERCAGLARALDPPPEDVLISEMGGSLVLDDEGLTHGQIVDVHPLALDEGGRVLSRDVISARRRLGERGVVAVSVAGLDRSKPSIAIDGSGVPSLDDPHFDLDRVRFAVLEEIEAHRAGRRGHDALDERIARRVGLLLRGAVRRRLPVLVTIHGAKGTRR